MRVFLICGYLALVVATIGCKSRSMEASNLSVRNGRPVKPEVPKKPIYAMRAGPGPCTISFVSKNVFVTAQHCFTGTDPETLSMVSVRNYANNRFIELSKDRPGGPCIFGEPEPSGIFGRNDTPMALSKYRDWAVCKTEKSYGELDPENASVAPVEIRYDAPKPGDKIIYRGYGGNGARGGWVSDTLVEGDGNLSAVSDELLEVWDVDLGNPNISTPWSGDSGGPVMDEQGHMIAIVRAISPGTKSGHKDYNMTSVRSKGFREAVEQMVGGL